MRLLDIVHPAAKTLVNISMSQDAEACPSTLPTPHHSSANLKLHSLKQSLTACILVRMMTPHDMYGHKNTSVKSEQSCSVLATGARPLASLPPFPRRGLFGGGGGGLALIRVAHLY